MVRNHGGLPLLRAAPLQDRWSSMRWPSAPAGTTPPARAPKHRGAASVAAASCARHAHPFFGSTGLGRPPTRPGGSPRPVPLSLTRLRHSCSDAWASAVKPPPPLAHQAGGGGGERRRPRPVDLSPRAVTGRRIQTGGEAPAAPTAGRSMAAPAPRRGPSVGLDAVVLPHVWRAATSSATSRASVTHSPTTGRRRLPYLSSADHRGITSQHMQSQQRRIHAPLEPRWASWPTLASFGARSPVQWTPALGRRAMGPAAQQGIGG